MNLARQLDWDIVSDVSKWPQETLCMKQHDGREYVAFGVLIHNQVPVTIFLRDPSHDADADFERTKTYASLQAMFDDGWLVD